MRATHTLASLCSLTMCLPPCVAQSEALPLFIGERACLECHTTDPCPIEPVPEHANAVASLRRPEAGHIAALSGIAEPPPESRICLDCHGTAAEEGPRWTVAGFDQADGVQCEACHGAGSLHAAAHRDADAVTTTARRLAPVDESICARCHVERPSHQRVIGEGYRRPEADARYRTPVNLAVAPDGATLYVVCENTDELLVVDPSSHAIRARIAVGRRPHDVSLSPDGRWIYVTNRFDATLAVIDAATATLVARIPVGAEPHGVLTDGTGQRVYVLNTGDDSISVVDTDRREEIARLPAGGGPWSLAMSVDDARIVVTSSRPQPAAFRESPQSELTVLDTGRGQVVMRPIAEDANMLHGVAFLPERDVALFTLMRTKNLLPITRLAQGWTITNGIGVLGPDGRIDQVLLDDPGDAFADATDVAVSPDGRRAVVTSGGADQIAIIDVPAMLEVIAQASERERRDVLPNHLGLSRRFVVARLDVGRNPRAVALTPDGRAAYVVNTLDDSISVIDVGSQRVTATIDLGGPELVTETRRGERLFHSAAITAGRQFSCRSCHPDGHTNGLTFDIEADGIGMHPVDNRTLRGILDTAPFKWEGTNPSLSRQCGPRLAVFFTRLAPYTPAQLQTLVRYICTIERPPNPHRPADGLTLAQRRGKLIFDRVTNNRGEPIAPEGRCVHCHGGPYGTGLMVANVGSTMWFDAPVDPDAVDLTDLDADIEDYGELGLYYYLDTGTPTRVFDVPHLTNIHASAPYLHNGAAGSLHEIWTRFDVLMQHGVTSDLSRRQLNDLVEYLRSR